MRALLGESFQTQVPPRCDPRCPFARIDLKAKDLVVSYNCKGPSVSKDGEVTREITLLPEKRAIARTVNPEIEQSIGGYACTNPGINMTIQRQIRLTEMEQ